MQVETPVDLSPMIENFVNHVNALLAANSIAMQSKKAHAEIGKKWTKIVIDTFDREGKRIGGSAYAFISMTANYTKTLGQLEFGGIYKPASWSAPAKHSRGNVQNPESFKCAGEYGIVYLN